ncbi:MAG: hypothetical protein U5N23_10800 [Acidovorax sp.]|nr:hypothetical protein [Acidovorax sp.]MDZ7863259.1 hypothetical protein [Acidovorax sp.]
MLDNVMAGPLHVLRQPRAQARGKDLALLHRVGLAEKAGPTRTSFRAGSSSAWRLRAPWPWSLR